MKKVLVVSAILVIIIGFAVTSEVIQSNKSKATRAKASSRIEVLHNIARDYSLDDYDLMTLYDPSTTIRTYWYKDSKLGNIYLADTYIKGERAIIQILNEETFSALEEAITSKNSDNIFALLHKFSISKYPMLIMCGKD